MTQHDAQAAKPADSPTVPILTAVIVIGLFVTRVVTPAHEYPMRTEQVMTMVFDALMFAGLFSMRRRIPAWLFWPTAVAAVGSILIRFTSDAAWWTGHLVYYLQPR